MTRRHILVTGGAGYIGSHMTLALLGAGERPLVIDNLSTGSRAIVPTDVPFFEGNVGDADFVGRGRDALLARIDHHQRGGRITNRQQPQHDHAKHEQSTGKQSDPLQIVPQEYGDNGRRQLRLDQIAAVRRKLIRVLPDVRGRTRGRDRLVPAWLATRHTHTPHEPPASPPRQSKYLRLIRGYSSAAGEARYQMVKEPCGKARVRPNRFVHSAPINRATTKLTNRRHESVQLHDQDVHFSLTVTPAAG